MADDEVIYAYGSDPEVTKYVIFETHRSIEDSRSFLRTALEGYSNGSPSSLAIELKNGPLIGTIGYFNWSNDHKRIEIGYALSRSHWNMGYVTEAARGLIGFMFAHSDLIRIQASCVPENLGSARVMEKAGMKFEGLLRKSVFAKGEHRDMKIYSIIRYDWERQDNH